MILWFDVLVENENAAAVSMRKTIAPNVSPGEVQKTLTGMHEMHHTAKNAHDTVVTASLRNRGFDAS
ncbi:hypothetical protein IE4803_PD00186 (plasmid) [Rhizobium etli bv. phaseoli str. IE4803]|nr:hypothetical protein IE4803_PD00186 [Rhizobium etli bv. phaseoli str. IE4803]